MSDFLKTKDEVKDRIKALGGRAKDFRENTHQIWLAGLGAFSKADEDGGSYFDQLVELGRSVEEKAKLQASSLNDRVEEVRSKVRSRADSTLEKMEQAFDERFNTVIGKLSAPSRKEIDNLNSKIKSLTSALGKLTDKDKEDK